ncbi:MAG: S41 family peptidase [Clostridiales bacterium]|nr:S41 family peptidase [Clostridiales bacterium]
MKKKLSWGDALMLMLLAAVTAGSIAFLMSYQNFNSRLANLKIKETQYAKFDQVIENVRQHFVGDYDDKALMDGAMKGYIDALGDKWSHYLTPEENALVQEDFKNQYAGVGMKASLEPKTNIMIVTDVYVGSPAEKAGIRKLDEILKINGKSIALDNEEIVNEMRGKAGTTVELEWKRADSKQTFKAKLVRENVTVQAVKSEMLGGSVGLVTISNFDDGVDKQFKKEVNSLIKSGAKALIFDVRFNSGGSTSSMIPALDMLLPKVKVFSMRDKSGQGQDYMSDASEIKLPMAVIVNQYSISAAEYFAAVLQEYGKADIVGTKTTGKCYAQELINLPDGSGIYLSTKKFLTPKGVNLAETGVTPDYKIDISDEEMERFSMLTKAQDVQLQKAYSVVVSKIS